MIPTATPTLAIATALFATSGPWAGKLAFILVFVLLLIWLAKMPPHLLGQTDGRPPWWRDTRFWAVVIVDVQVVAYLWWG